MSDKAATFKIELVDKTPPAQQAKAKPTPATPAAPPARPVSAATPPAGVISASRAAPVQPAALAASPSIPARTTVAAAGPSAPTVAAAALPAPPPPAPAPPPFATARPSTVSAPVGALPTASGRPITASTAKTGPVTALARPASATTAGAAGSAAAQTAAVGAKGFGLEAGLAAAGPIGLAIAAAVERLGALGAVASRNAGPIGAAIGSGENLGATAAGAALDLAGEAVPALKPVIGAVEVASKAFSAAAQAAAAKLKTLGAAAAAVAQGDLAGAQMAQVQRQKLLDESVPIIGGIISYFRGNAEKEAALGAFRDVVGAIEAKAQTLAPYSAPLSGALAQARVTQIQNNVQLADQLGPALARATEAKSNYDAAVNRALAPFAKQLAEQYARLAESGEINSEQAKKMLEALGDQTKLLELIKDDSEAARQLQAEIKRHLKDIKEKGMGEGAFTAGNIVDQLMRGAGFLDALGGLDNDPQQAPDWARDAALRPLEV